MENTKATLSVSIIAKDEEETIVKALKSLESVADEIVVLIDDATTDKTFELVSQFLTRFKKKSHLSYFKWEEDFAKARNEAWNFCTCDFVMIMDAHESLHPDSQKVLNDILARSVEGGDLNAVLFFSGYAYMFKEQPKTLEALREGYPDVFFLQPRVFRRTEGLRFEGKSHNYIVGSSEKYPRKFPINELIFVHARSDENAQKRAEQRRTMNLKNLEDDIKNEPDKPRPYFYLAQTYLEIKDYKKAEKYYKIYLGKSEWGDERAQAYLGLSTMLAGEDDDARKEEAKKYALLAITERWDRAEPYLLLGDIAFEVGKDKDLSDFDRIEAFYEAEHWYKAATKMKPPISSLFLHGPSYAFLPYERLCQVYDRTCRWQDAIENGLIVLKFLKTLDSMLRNIQVWEKNLQVIPENRSILVFARGAEFIAPIAEYFTKHNYNVALHERFDSDLLTFCHKPGDIVFFEWCDVNVVEATRSREKPANQKWVVRLHSYESYTNFPASVDWNKIDHLIFVSKCIAEKCKRRFPSITCPTSIISNGVDYQDYSFAIRKSGKNFGFVGVFSWKKGIQGLMMTLKWLKTYMPDFILHARVDFYEGDTTVRQAADYWDYKYAELKNNIKFYPRREKHLDGWLEDMDFVLSCSTIEAFSYYIAEAMCKGIKPLIYDWEGSRDVWPSDLVWDDFGELQKLIEGKYESKRYRDYIVKRYSRERQTDQFKKLFEKLKN